MKTKLIYIIMAILIFCITSGAILYLNSKYTNIFKFDFTTKNVINKKDLSDSLAVHKVKLDSLKNIAEKDSLKIETPQKIKLKIKVGKEAQILDSLSNLLNNKNAISNATDIRDQILKNNNRDTVITINKKIKKKKEEGKILLAQNNQLKDSIGVLLKQLKTLKNNLTLNKNELEKARAIKEKKEKKEYKDWIKKTSDIFAIMDSKKAAKLIQNYSDNISRDIIYTMKKKKAADVLNAMNDETASKILSVK